MPKNGNITGQVFDQEVTNQIEYRQNYLGARYKNDSHIVYGNNVNAFLRLASSVNVGTSSSPIDVTKTTETSDGKKVTTTVDDPLARKTATDNLLLEGKNQLKSRKINENLTGMELAKACVLFGGTVGIDNKLSPNRKFGIVDNGGSGTYDYVSTIAAYGWGGISSKGFVPMPSIESADISFYNRGALAKASVKIKVYSVEQLQIFDALYLRIGYTMLLEWGHNIWLDNKLAKDTNNNNPLKVRDEFVTKPFELFFTEGSTQQNIIQSIHEQRAKDSYNYDAMLGKVTNFSWRFNDDGSYDIDLNLVGLGDIIESLKINKANIVLTKTELTPSQIDEKKQANIAAGIEATNTSDKSVDTKVEDAKKALQTKIDNVNKELKKITDSIKTIAKSINSQTNSTDTFKTNATSLNVTMGVDDATNNAAATAINTFDAQLKNWKKSWVRERDSNDTEFNKIFGGTVTRLEGKIAELRAQYSLITGKDLKAVKDTESDADRIKKENELKRKGYDAASQRIKRDEEIRSLSPITSVETKNKTILNLQLYNWRQDAIAGTNKNNLYKLTFTADSSNPDSTGTAKLSLNFYYVRLGYLLEWIQNNLLIYDNTKKFDPEAITFSPKNKTQTSPQNNKFVSSIQSNSILNPTPSTPLFFAPTQPAQDPPASANPIFEIDTTIETNLCLRFPAQFSADPKVCVIPSKYVESSVQVPKQNIKWDILSDLQQLAPYFIDGNDYAAKLMNIFVNIDHVAGCVDKNTDANGKTSLLKFLTTLFNDINDALGNVNKLEPVFDAESNMLKIIEGSSLERVEELINAKEKQLNTMAVFQVYGIGTEDTPYGSFIKNVDFQVQLPPNMAAMATISAQASGNIVGENATGLSKLNTGLTDRLITIKLDKDSIEGAQTGKVDPKTIFQQNIQSVQKVINSLYKDKFYSKDTIDSVRSANRDIALYLTGNDALEGNMPSPFFIPFNLSLSMDGLSGMRNYERFSITEQILPYSYRPNSTTNRNGVIDFLIKGISHSIKDNKWETKIESLTVSSNRKWSIQDLQNVSTQNQ
jgi:hypothetical protein